VVCPEHHRREVDRLEGHNHGAGCGSPAYGSTSPTLQPGKTQKRGSCRTASLFCPPWFSCMYTCGKYTTPGESICGLNHPVPVFAFWVPVPVCFCPAFRCTGPLGPINI
jgi:hypothetical protein